MNVRLTLPAVPALGEKPLDDKARFALRVERNGEPVKIGAASGIRWRSGPRLGVATPFMDRENQANKGYSGVFEGLQPGDVVKAWVRGHGSDVVTFLAESLPTVEDADIPAKASRKAPENAETFLAEMAKAFASLPADEASKARAGIAKALGITPAKAGK